MYNQQSGYEQQQQPGYNQQPNNNMGYGVPPVNNYSPNYEDNIPEKYKPISTLGYIGYMLLFSIPCVNIILMLVYAFGSNTNVNLKNLSRAYLIIFVVTIVISIIFGVIMGASLFALIDGISSSSSSSMYY